MLLREILAFEELRKKHKCRQNADAVAEKEIPNRARAAGQHGTDEDTHGQPEPPLLSVH
jgi:hypothetical protein